MSWVAAVASAVACAPEEPQRELPPITWSGEHLDYAPQEGAYALCAGTLPYMDRHVALAAEAMGVELKRPLLYVQGSDEAETFCEHEGTLGCAFRDSVYSLVAPQEHELVHGVRSRVGFSHLFFEEGTAELFGDDATMTLRKPANGDLLEGIESASGEHGLPLHWYPRAGHFAAYLHDQYGASVTEALLRRTDPYSIAKEAIGVIEEVTVVSFDELREAYAREPTCDQAHYRYPLVACEDPAALRARCEGGEAVSFAEDVACDDPETLGPRDGEIWKYVAFEVEQDGEYEITAYSPESAAGERVVVKECSMRCDSILVEVEVGIVLDREPVFLRAGRYAMRIARPEGEPGEVQVAVLGECG